jgi:hypothetical protein
MEELPAERLLRKLRGIAHPPRASEYAGVSWNTQKGKWIASVQKNRKIAFRICESEEEAARIYDVAVRLLWEGVPKEEWPPNCPCRKPRNLDGQPPEGIPAALIKLWLIDAGLLD